MATTINESIVNSDDRTAKRLLCRKCGQPKIKYPSGYTVCRPCHKVAVHLGKNKHDLPDQVKIGANIRRKEAGAGTIEIEDFEEEEAALVEELKPIGEFCKTAFPWASTEICKALRAAFLHPGTRRIGLFALVVVGYRQKEYATRLFVSGGGSFFDGEPVHDAMKDAVVVCKRKPNGIWMIRRPPPDRLEAK